MTKQEMQQKIDRMTAALHTVRHGLERGFVKSKPIIDDDPQAKTLKLRSLYEIVEEALK